MVDAVDTLLVFAGGGLGAVSRWLLSDAVQRHAPWAELMPWGTLAVNVLGSLLLGFIMAASLHGFLSREQRLLWATGFAGGFTTFSTFSYETAKLLEDAPLYAAANIALNLTLGLLAVYIGHALAALLVARPR